MVLTWRENRCIPNYWNAAKKEIVQTDEYVQREMGDPG
jgi:hypothetical protein